MRSTIRLGSAALGVTLLVSVAGGSALAQDVSGSVDVHGSSTVAPISLAVSEDLKAANDGFGFTVGEEGTGDGFKQFLHILDGGRIGVSAMGVGMAQGALDEALAYAKERRAFGQPISKFQAIQAKIADISAEIEAARLLTYKAAILKDRGESFTLTAAQAKLKTGRLAVRACEEAVQIHGGYGYIEEYPVCRFYRDAKILTIGEGTDEVQQMVIARQLGC